MTRNREGRECPEAIRRILVDRWGHNEAFPGLVYPGFAKHFNRQTVIQAIELAVIAKREQPITLRGVFYRAVSAGLFPDTSEAWYRQCGNIMVKLRRAGITPYQYITDSTRRRLKPSSWSGLADYAEAVAQSYRKDLWTRQRDYVEIFVEKDAMAAVIEPVSEGYDITLNIIRGNVSESFVWQIAEQWKRIEKPIFAYYLGDHDPAGLAIEDDIYRRLSTMTGGGFAWKRLAITAEDFNRSDVLGFAIKGNRATKAWKTKHGSYLGLYGDRCVEVDALQPAEIRSRIRETIERHIDAEEWHRLQALETTERETVQKFALAQRIA